MAEPSPTAAYKRICYYTSWSQYRSEDSLRYFPRHADVGAQLCTHIFFAFAAIDAETLRLNETSVGSLGADVVALKNRHPALKVSLAVGGWNNAGKGFVDVVRTRESRSRFNAHAVEWLRSRGYDGLSIDWEYPGAKERGSGPADKRRFTLWLRELKNVFEREAATTGKERLSLTAAVPASAYWVRLGFQVEELCQTLDFVNLMAYDLHGDWVRPMVTGHHAGLYLGGGAEISVNAAVTMWRRKCAVKGKCGPPYTGYTSWSLVGPERIGPADGPADRLAGGRRVKERSE